MIPDERIRSARRVLPTLLGLGICAAIAAVAAKLFAKTAVAPWVPLLFLVVLMVLAAAYGTAVGVLGSLLSALIFAYLLFSPLHSTDVADHAARSSLAWMVVGGVALSYLLAPGFRDRPH